MNNIKINFFIILFFSTTNFAMLKNSTQEEIFLSNLAEHVKEGKSFFDELPVLVLEEIAKYITIFDNKDRFFLKKTNLCVPKKEFINVFFTEDNSLISVEHKKGFIEHPGHIKLNYWQLNKTIRKKTNKYLLYYQAFDIHSSYLLSGNNQLFITNKYNGTRYTFKDKIDEYNLYDNHKLYTNQAQAIYLNNTKALMKKIKKPDITKSNKLKKQIKKLLKIKYINVIKRYKKNDQLNFQKNNNTSNPIIYKILDEENNKVIIISSKSIDIWDTTFFNNPSLENFLLEFKKPKQSKTCIIL